MDAIQKCKQEYEIAKANLLQLHDINGHVLCARGRAYRAMSMAPQFMGNEKKKAAFVQTFDKLANEANLLIAAYNDASFAYNSFANFGGTTPEIELPECNCEGCKIYAN